MHHDIVKLYKPVTKVWMVRQRTWLNNLLVNVACRGHAAIVDLLIQNGANRQGSINWALWYACQGKHGEVAALLVRHGAHTRDFIDGYYPAWDGRWDTGMG